jgi:ribosome-associated protein
MTVGVADELRVTRTCSIPLSEIDWRFTPSGGPGGQHANRSNTRAEARFDIAGSPSLGPRQRARLLERLGEEVRVVADDERSQARNRSLALDRLRSKLAAALKQDKPRHPTRPTKASQDQRIEAKRKRANLKRQRRRPQVADEA